MYNIAALLFYIKMMREKLKNDNEPGFLHFIVLSDYIREAVQKGYATWTELGLSDEAQLCLLALECLKAGEEAGFKFEEWMKPALEAKLKLAQGKPLTAEEGDNVVELFPDAVAA